MPGFQLAEPHHFAFQRVCGLLQDAYRGPQLLVVPESAATAALVRRSHAASACWCRRSSSRANCTVSRTQATVSRARVMRFDADEVVAVDVIDEDGVEGPLPREQARTSCLHLSISRPVQPSRALEADRL